MGNLIGVGLYTPAEAGRLLDVPVGKISRWLRGHKAGGKSYEPLWQPEIDLGDGKFQLGFRDLMEVRVAAAFINYGVSALKVRAAIREAAEIIQQGHPLSTNRFRTDGREIFLHVIEEGEDGEDRERLLNLFKRQYEFNGVIDPILKTVDFGDDGNPAAWWPRGRRVHVMVTPSRAFGAPIDSVSSVPTSILANVAKAQGIAATAKAYNVTELSIRHALDFEASLEQRQAA
ncbi:hypothetical protein [Paracoccus haeundaensis]|uniref:DUF433 domain-containing protein n=1 Tax=Paracoccus haeundaensis TaxID=225362 RepID=A0A5C4RAX7_9RHOB|nr:hypothetical protein [Paracoccus haeundaensis]TNH41120.1 hypothetical protein FHD67_01670 [Paracoccus haeundaensis]